MRIADVMTRNVECIKPDATVREAASRMKELEVGPLPVCENDRLVGMVTDRDIAVRAVAEGSAPDERHVRDVMTPEVVWCFDDQDVREGAQLMKQNQIRRLVVLDRTKRMVGIVSIGDLAVETQDDRLAGDALEAISEPNRPAR